MKGRRCSTAFSHIWFKEYATHQIHQHISHINSRPLLPAPHRSSHISEPTPCLPHYRCSIGDSAALSYRLPAAHQKGTLQSIRYVRSRDNRAALSHASDLRIQVPQTYHSYRTMGSMQERPSGSHLPPRYAFRIPGISFQLTYQSPSLVKDTGNYCTVY